MQTAVNPIRRMREKRGLSARDFAILLGVGYASLNGAENGLPAKLNPTLLAGFGRIGYDPDQVQAVYRDWRTGEQQRQMDLIITAKE
jgi:transcriptional regulator with XRE-family HTH domain